MSKSFEGKPCDRHNQQKSLDEELDMLAASSKARYLSSMDNIIRKYERIAKIDVATDVIDLEKMEIIEDNGTLKSMKAKKGIRMTYFYQTKYEREKLRKITTIVQTEILSQFNGTETSEEENSSKEVSKSPEDTNKKRMSLSLHLERNNIKNKGLDSFTGNWEDIALWAKNNAFSDSDLYDTVSDSSISSDSSDDPDFDTLDESISPIKKKVNKKSYKANHLKDENENSIHKSVALHNRSLSNDSELAKNMELSYYKVICDEVKNKTLNAVFDVNPEVGNYRLLCDSDFASKKLNASQCKYYNKFLRSRTISDVNSSIQSSSSSNANSSNSFTEVSSSKQDCCDKNSKTVISTQNAPIKLISPVKSTERTPKKSAAVSIQPLNASFQNKNFNKILQSHSTPDSSCPATQIPNSTNSNNASVKNISLSKQDSRLEHLQNKKLRKEYTSVGVTCKPKQLATVPKQQSTASLQDNSATKQLHSRNIHDLTCSFVQIANSPKVSISPCSVRSSSSRQTNTTEHLENEKWTRQEHSPIRNAAYTSRKSVSFSSMSYDNFPSLYCHPTPVTADKDDMNKTMNTKRSNIKYVNTTKDILNKSRKTDKSLLEQHETRGIHNHIKTDVITSVSTLSSSYTCNILAHKKKEYPFQLKQKYSVDRTTQEKSRSPCRKNTSLLQEEMTPCCLSQMVSRNESILKNRLQCKQLTISNLEITQLRNGKAIIHNIERHLQTYNTVINLPKQLFMRNDIEEDKLLNFCEWKKSIKQLRR